MSGNEERKRRKFQKKKIFHIKERSIKPKVCKRNAPLDKKGNAECKKKFPNLNFRKSFFFKKAWKGRGKIL